MVEDLIVSCCTEVNNSVANECHMNPDVRKWTSMSKGSDNFVSLHGRRSKGRGRGLVRETTRKRGGMRGTPARKPLFSPSHLLIKKITKITQL